MFRPVQFDFFVPKRNLKIIIIIIIIIVQVDKGIVISNRLVSVSFNFFPIVVNEFRLFQRVCGQRGVLPEIPRASPPRQTAGLGPEIRPPFPRGEFPKFFNHVHASVSVRTPRVRNSGRISQRTCSQRILRQIDFRPRRGPRSSLSLPSAARSSTTSWHPLKTILSLSLPPLSRRAHDDAFIISRGEAS